MQTSLKTEQYAITVDGTTVLFTVAAPTAQIATKVRDALAKCFSSEVRVLKKRSVGRGGAPTLSLYR
jgi:hypothetical protein